MAFLSGKDGYVKIGTFPYSFGKWKLSMKNKLAEVNNFNSDYRRRVNGLTDAQLTLEGPYDSTAMAFTVGNAYTFILGFTTGLELTASFYIENIEPTVDVDDATRVTITASTDGSFTAAIA